MVELVDYIDFNSLSYYDGGYKKLLIFGRLKDKIKKVGLKIKYKVGKKKINFDGIIIVDNEDEGEEMSSNSDVRI